MNAKIQCNIYWHYIGNLQTVADGTGCPLQDLIVPAFKPPTVLQHSPYRAGAVPRERNLLLFFMGDFRDGTPQYGWYSRFIRQSLRLAAKRGQWWEKYRIFIGTRQEGPPGVAYGELLASSVFCLLAPGEI